MILVLAPSPALDVTYLLDEVQVGAIHRPREVIRSAGGKGLNVARAAVQLGGTVRVVAVLGGPIGTLVAELARGAGLRVTTVPSDSPTRECVSAIPESGDPTEFYEQAVPLGPGAWEALVGAASARPADWIAVSGRMPPGSGSRMAELLAERRRAGVRIAVDSSGPDLAELLDRVAPDLLKINRAEAAELVRVDPAAELGALAAAVRRRTGGAVVITDGAAGAVAVDEEGAWTAAPDPRPGRFAIGSGDSFLAGMLVGFERGDGMADALLLASAAGSANTRIPGAARFDGREVAAAAARIRIAPARVLA